MFDDDEREQLPTEASAIHQLLVRDSSHWARRVPDNTRMSEFARAVPQRIPARSAQQIRNILAHRRPSSTLSGMMSTKGQAAMFNDQRPGRARVASIAAVAVVALIVGVLFTVHSVHDTRAGSGGSPATSTPVVPTATPYSQGGINATPGPLGLYVSKFYTTSEPPTDGASVNVKSHFVVGDVVYVSARIHGLPEGVHTISNTWYRDGNALAGSSGAFTRPITGDELVYFGMTLSEQGNYMVRIYIDRPVNDTSDSPSDPTLAGTILFFVEAS